MTLARLLAAAMAFMLAAPPAALAAPGRGAAVVKLERGINVLGYDPIWQDSKKGRFQGKHFKAIRKAGFDFIRVNLHAFRHMKPSGELDKAWLDRLDWVVRGAGAAGLAVILDEHDFTACSSDPAACRVKLSQFWSQVAPRYSKAPPNVMFELLNEPHDKLDAEQWNGLFADLLAIVRRSNPSRTVVIGPTRWNNMDELPSLRLPEGDRNILATFHYYDPFRFTHQGTSWTDLVSLRGIGWGSEEDRARLARDFAKVAAWSKANGRPVLLGEFGAYDKNGTPMPLRVAYTSAVAREAEKNGFSWAYWQFDSDFIAYDIARDAWVEPLRNALIPEK